MIKSNSSDSGEISQPLISVIMNCYNSEKYLQEAIDSVLAQTYQNLEIIFWDNQSSDKSQEIVKSIKDDRIKYFLSQSHTTLGEARNLAMEKANGEYISFLDCDDVIASRKIELQVIEFQKDKSLGLVYCNGARIDHNGCVKTSFYKKRKPSGNIFRKTLSSYDLYIPAVMFRKDCIIKKGIKFNERFRFIEEYDFFLRILKSFTAKYIDRKLAFWRVHDKSNTWKHYNEFINERNIFLQIFFSSDEKIKFQKEINSIKDLNTFQYSLVSWKEGDNLTSRNAIKKIKTRKLKYFITYLAMFFDFKVLYPLLCRIKYIK
ncbi:MAG: glycosyltransferase [Thiothrix sp.]|uniref:glycosyltransferase n=1 Tax=Thiothrix sp. TaxID=1032 RepID=UPI0026116130|nr:glycosyltransferase [Thiothrix sp.]MDD5392928.1 glycosyltransferase [Thiothrix sp.]